MATSKVCVEIRPGGKRTGAGSERGGSFVEFTLVMPVLLLIMTGMVCFGFALHNDLVLTNAVNTGAQLLAISRGQTADPCVAANTAISGAAPSLTTGLSQGASAQVMATCPRSLAVFGTNFPS